MSFTKIKYSKGAVSLSWVNQREKDTTETTLSSFDPPRPEFVAALQALTAHVVDVCELPEDYAEGLTVIGVSISENEHQGRGIVVTATKKVAGASAPVLLNTPHVPEHNEHGPALRTLVLEELETLCEEATRYRAGERAQVEMFAKAGAS